MKTVYSGYACALSIYINIILKREKLRIQGRQLLFLFRYALKDINIEFIFIKNLGQCFWFFSRLMTVARFLLPSYLQILCFLQTFSSSKIFKFKFKLGQFFFETIFLNFYTRVLQKKLTSGVCYGFYIMGKLRFSRVEWYNSLDLGRWGKFFMSFSKIEINLYFLWKSRFSFCVARPDGRTKNPRL